MQASVGCRVRSTCQYVAYALLCALFDSGLAMGLSCSKHPSTLDDELVDPSWYRHFLLQTAQRYSYRQISGVRVVGGCTVRTML